MQRNFALIDFLQGSSLGGCLYPVLLNNLFSKSAGFGAGVRSVFQLRVPRMPCSVIENIPSSVAYIDLGLLVIANLIMKTRLPTRTSTVEKSSVLTEVLTDVPYIVFIWGSFLVSTISYKK